jgi:trigger factor
LNVTSCEKKENNAAELTVLVTPEEFDKALNESYRKNKGSISVPGFRKGKAPRKLIENMYGASVFYDDALDIILPSVCGHGVEESALRTVGYPQIQDVSFGDDKSVTVKYSVELYPEVTVGEYKGIGAVRPDAVVEESAVDSEIASVRLRNARIQTTERPAINGDTVTLDFEGFVDGVAFEGGKGENYELELGSNTFIPGFEAKLQGMTTGEERDLDLVFPEDYKADLAGKPVVFKVKVREIKEKILPELDDEFAKDVSEFDTLGEYRNSIRENLTKAKQAESDKAFEDAVLTKLADTVENDVPEAMIRDFLDNQVGNMRQQLASYGMQLEQYLNMMGTTEEGFRETMRPNAVRQIKTTLALEKIAELEKFAPSDEEVEKYFADMAERYGVDAETVRQSVPKDTAERELGIQAASKLVVENAVAVPPEDEDAADGKKAAKTKTAKKAKADKAEADAEAGGEAEPSGTEEKKAAPKKAPAKKAAAKTVEDVKKTDAPAGETAEKKPAKKPAAKKPAPKNPDDGGGANHE